VGQKRQLRQYNAKTMQTHWIFILLEEF